MSSEAIIRPATLQDLSALLELLEQLFSLESDFSFNGENERRGLQMFLEDTRTRQIFVAELDGAVVGMTSVQLLISTAMGAPSGWVEDVILTSGTRGQGLGTRLMQAVEAWCRKQGATRVQVNYDTENTPALAFYSKCGFEKTHLLMLRKYL